MVGLARLSVLPSGTLSRLCYERLPYGEPVMRQGLVDAFGLMRRNAFQHVGKPLLGMYSVQLAS